MRIFLDTEFTSLSDPRLISVGLAAENGPSFYGICTDFNLSHCTRFVRERVLPQLNRHPPDCQGGHGRLAEHLSQWLCRVSAPNHPITIVGSDECDQELWNRLRHDMPPDSLNITFQMAIQIVQFLARDCERHFQNGSPAHQHNALDDAHALRRAIMLRESQTRDATINVV